MVKEVMEEEMKEIAEMEGYWPGRRGEVMGRRSGVIGGGDCSVVSRREQPAPRGVLDPRNGSPPRGLPLGADHSSPTRLLPQSQRSYQMRHEAGWWSRGEQEDLNANDEALKSHSITEIQEICLQCFCNVFRILQTSNPHHDRHHAF